MVLAAKRESASLAPLLRSELYMSRVGGSPAAKAQPAKSNNANVYISFFISSNTPKAYL